MFAEFGFCPVSCKTAIQSNVFTFNKQRSQRAIIRQPNTMQLGRRAFRLTIALRLYQGNDCNFSEKCRFILVPLH
jgi:hypothetical protein